MTGAEHTVLSLICLASAFVWGRVIGVKAGIVATLEHLEDEGVLKFDREKNNDDE